MVVAAISKYFYPGECAIYESGDVFDFQNKSIVGTKSFCITNHGRVFAHDTGGIFGEEQTKIYVDRIDVTFSDYNIILSNKKSSIVSFAATVSTSEFVEIYEKVPEDKFVCKWNGKIPCIYTYSEEIGNSTSYAKLDELQIKSNKLMFAKDKETLPFYRIKSVVRKMKYLEIKGVFSLHGSNKTTLKLYIFDENLKKEIIDKVNSNPSIFQQIGAITEIYPTTLSATFSDEVIRDKEVTICFDASTIYFIDEKKTTCLGTLLRSSTNAYYSKLDEKLAFECGDFVYVITVIDVNLKEYLMKYFIKSTRIFINRLGKLHGVFHGETWKQQEVNAITEGRHIRLSTTNTQKLLTKLDLTECEILNDDKKIFIIRKNQIALLRLHEYKNLHLFTQPEEKITATFSFGYNDNDDPFFIKQDEEKIVLSQSPSSMQFKYYNEKITDISISKYGEDETFFSEINISLRDESKSLVINVPNAIIKDLIYKTYYFSKRKSLDLVSTEQLYLSYSRQVNDYILYQYYGQIFAMYEGLKDIQQAESNKEVLNRKIINFLYYSIKALKNHFDTVSIYLPASLEREIQEIANDTFQTSTSAYKSLQRGLLGITGQVNRALNEIEGSLSAVSFMLIKREDYNNLVKEKTNRDLGFSGGMAALGVATIGFNPIAPMLILGGVLSGINSFFRESDAIKQEELRKQNEEYRVDFYVGKSLDAVEHLIHTLLPYFISETNDYVFRTFNLVSQQYQELLDTPEVKGNLFTKISQYYTFKQLPIDYSVLIKKNDLIGLTHSSVNRSEMFIEQFQREVIGNVPKSIEATTIK
ncbi:hypothetical protein LS684_20155 [Cytobacillus spongiae]|uniref:hypothetical protein n=1 Tax=Cytobacillus spongiae TaxID=2901381 RepID=UPI001F2B3689|nr:hypothetical protein [Cytobacillus spongiae]UII55905.1 hypothetical protein LS684_20155 [Cytobacillus spongiae]